MHFGPLLIDIIFNTLSMYVQAAKIFISNVFPLRGKETQMIRIGKSTIYLTSKHNLLDTHLQAIEVFPPFVRWIHRLTSQLADRKVAHLLSITITDVDLFSSGKIGFVKLLANVEYGDGTKIPGIVLLRGDAVAILVRIRMRDGIDVTCEERGQVWVVMVEQPRIALGSMRNLEIPAGMIDGESNFSGVAAKELEEECGIVLNSRDLIEMSPQLEGDEPGLVLSGGLCDERIRLYFCEKELAKSDVLKLNGHLAGLREDGERIRTVLVPWDDVIKSSNDVKAIVSLYLWNLWKDQTCKDRGSIKE